MRKETGHILKKTIKIAGITCIALGSAALIASGAALKALTEGAGYLKNSVKKIIDEKPGTAEVIVDAVAEEMPCEETAQAEETV